MAAAPDTCGTAKEVPSSPVLTAESLVLSADGMATPGAKRSVQLPELLEAGMWSVSSVALTVITPGTRAGPRSHAIPYRLPAEATTVKPSLTRSATARSRSLYLGSAGQLMLRL